MRAVSFSIRFPPWPPGTCGDLRVFYPDGVDAGWAVIDALLEILDIPSPEGIDASAGISGCGEIPGGQPGAYILHMGAGVVSAARLIFESPPPRLEIQHRAGPSLSALSSMLESAGVKVAKFQQGPGRVSKPDDLRVSEAVARRGSTEHPARRKRGAAASRPRARRRRRRP